MCCGNLVWFFPWENGSPGPQSVGGGERRRVPPKWSAKTGGQNRPLACGRSAGIGAIDVPVLDDLAVGDTEQVAVGDRDAELALGRTSTKSPSAITW